MSEQTEKKESVSTFGDLLAQSRSGDSPPSRGSEAPAPEVTPPAEVTPAAPEVKAETPVPPPEKPPEPTPPAPAAPAPATPPPATPSDPADLQRQIDGMRSAMIAERRRAQELAQKLSQYESGEAPTYQESTTTTPAEPNGDARLVKISEMIVRQQYPDYDEKLRALEEAVAGNPALGIAPNLALWESVKNAEVPAMAAYQAGEYLQFQKKYGVDTLASPAKFHAAVRAEVESSLRKQVQSELEAKFLGIARERANQPTDISPGRAPGPAVEKVYNDPGFAGLLAQAHKRR